MHGVYVIFINGVSFVFLFVFLHLGRAISYALYFFNPNTWYFWNDYLLLHNGDCIYRLCFTFRTNEFMRSYNHCKLIMSISILKE